MHFAMYSYSNGFQNIIDCGFNICIHHHIKFFELRCVCMCVHVHVCVCVFACMCVYAYVSICTCACTCMCIDWIIDGLGDRVGVILTRAKNSTWSLTGPDSWLHLTHVYIYIWSIYRSKNCAWHWHISHPRGASATHPG